ncbi:lysophospholipid acyltransferase family protein [Variovorax sp. VNK109]|uniref:lysophospholipid acyltransferase family protein n=1 Tax=Variovorax sp. VNK109 TaxID=3400919 RepID=UPI003C0DF731
MKGLRALWRMLIGFGHVLRGLAIIIVRFPRMTQHQRNLRVQVWAAEMLGILGITLKVTGQPPVSGPALLVANHISWLDILVMHAARHCRFVSKSDVKHWPLIGRLATGAGTLYIERESRRDALRVVHHMADSLRGGDVVAVFPEGTTGDGRAMLPFHANLMQAAISAPAPLQPVGMRFVDAATGETSFAPSYIGDETLIGSIWRTLTAPPIVAVVNFGEPCEPQGDRRALSRLMHAQVDSLRKL